MRKGKSLILNEREFFSCVIITHVCASSIRENISPYEAHIDFNWVFFLEVKELLKHFILHVKRVYVWLMSTKREKTSKTRIISLFPHSTALPSLNEALLCSAAAIGLSFLFCFEKVCSARLFNVFQLFKKVQACKKLHFLKVRDKQTRKNATE